MAFVEGSQDGQGRAPLEAHVELVARLYRRSGAARWGLPADTFEAALARSLAHRFGQTRPGGRAVEQYLESLHAGDLALACACSRGDERAWEHFVTELRPALHRAAAAAVGPDAGRELADSLYAELYGLEERNGLRRSLLDYFHGRSSLMTWLRSVLAQRAVDRARAHRRETPLPDDESVAPPSPAVVPDPDRPRYLGMLRTALIAALEALEPRDRLRLAMYYTQGLTLAETGRALGEHEATVSRKLERTRRDVRHAVERRLRDRDRLTNAEVKLCFDYALGDWPFDLRKALPQPDV